jgi:integrase
MRHTFAFWCLNHDITTEDIAMLIGDSVEVVAKYYSVWIHGRQERLTQRMVEALKNKSSKA